LRKGKREPKELFSEQQERFLDKYAKGVTWQKARLLGPVKTGKWEFAPDGFPYELTMELWHLPGCEQGELLEFSTKVRANDAANAEKDLLELMKQKQVRLSRSPKSKTQTVLKCLLKRPAT
jgi:hypothetical protein